MLIPLKQFICDTCGSLIENIDEGWVEWEANYEDDKKNTKNFRICHHNVKCQVLSNHPHVSDLPLREFTGDKAIVQTIGMIDIGPYHEPIYKGPEATDLREFAEFQRRLTLPYYEEARQFWGKATSDGYFGDSNEIYIYLPDNLRRMIEYYAE